MKYIELTKRNDTLLYMIFNAALLGKGMEIRGAINEVEKSIVENTPEAEA